MTDRAGNPLTAKGRTRGWRKDWGQGGIILLGFLSADVKRPVVYQRRRDGQEGPAPAQAGRLSRDIHQGGLSAGAAPQTRNRKARVEQGRGTGNRGVSQGGAGQGGRGSRVPPLQATLDQLTHGQPSCGCSQGICSPDGRRGGPARRRAGPGTQSPEVSGRALVGLWPSQREVQGFPPVGWWWRLCPGPCSLWLGVQRAGCTPRHQSLGLLCASVDSSPCFSRGSQGPTAPAGPMPASLLAWRPSTLEHAIARPRLNKGEGAMAPPPLKPASVWMDETAPPTPACTGENSVPPKCMSPCNL